MKVVVNGDELELESAAVLSDVLRRFDLEPDSVAAAVNGDIITRQEFDKLELHPGDRIELVRPIAGGSGEEITDDR